MKYRPVVGSASLNPVSDITAQGLSRRRFLTGASALGVMALASAARAQSPITTTASYDNCAALWQQHAARRSPARLVAERQWPDGEHARGRDSGPAPGATDSRFSEPRLQLAQGDAGLRRRGLLRDRPGLPRLWPHRWLGQFLGRRPDTFLMLNMVRDQIALVHALGYHKTEMVVGHDQGELIALYAAIIRPDMFPRLTTSPRLAARRHHSRSPARKETRLYQRRTRRGVRQTQSAAAEAIRITGPASRPMRT